MSDAIKKITEQQAKLQEQSAPWVVGEQLKEICEDPACAELVAADLENASMSLTECEKKIKAYADKNRVKGANFAYVSPKAAEKIIREFYGLPEAGAAPRPASGVIDLSDFL